MVQTMNYQKPNHHCYGKTNKQTTTKKNQTNRTRSLWTCCHKFINWAIYYHILQVFLFNDTLLSMYGYLTLNLQPNSTGTRAWMKLIYYIHFHSKGHHSLLKLRNTKQHCSTILGNHLNSDITKGKAQIFFKCGIHHKKYICLQYEKRNKTDRCLVWPQLEKHVPGDSTFSAFWIHACLCITVKAPPAATFWHYR